MNHFSVRKRLLLLVCTSANAFFLIPGCASLTIIGGKKVAPDSRPFMVSIQGDGEHLCGGALIAHDWILTATHCHCLLKGRKVQIVLGVYCLSKANQAQVIEVKKFFPHEGYNSTAKVNDIMMIKGDCGGPLLCEDTYRGIASFGTRKCQGKLPSVYTRLTREYLGWIQHVMNNY